MFSKRIFEYCIMKDIEKKVIIRKTKSKEKILSPQLRSDTPNICCFGFKKVSNPQNCTINFPFVSMTKNEFD